MARDSNVCPGEGLVVKSLHAPFFTSGDPPGEPPARGRTESLLTDEGPVFEERAAPKPHPRVSGVTMPHMTVRIVCVLRPRPLDAAIRRAATALLLAGLVAGPRPSPAADALPAAPKVLAFASVSPLKVEVVPDRPNWTYAVGDNAKFVVRVTRDGLIVPGVKLSYEIGFEKMPAAKAGQAEMVAEGLTFETGPIEKAGFVACAVEVKDRGHTYKGRAAAAFSPETLQPTVRDPEDFDAFWRAGKAQLAAVPLDARITPDLSRSKPGVDCSHVSLANVPQAKPAAELSAAGPAPARLYGILCEPVGRGALPALLLVPGAGVRGYQGAAELAAKGVITFQIGIHGVPVNLDDEVYGALARGPLSNYPTIHAEDRQLYYYRRVFLGAVRANDFLVTRPRWDKRNLGVMGGSQGGALAITTAALDPRVKGLVSYYPALSDHTGFLHERAGGWPFLLRPEEARTPARIETLAYFDVVNFARRLKVPGFYSLGYNDETCPPTSIFAVYNSIKAPKTLRLALANGHHTTPEQSEEGDGWMLTRLGVVPAQAKK